MKLIRFFIIFFIFIIVTANNSKFNNYRKRELMSLGLTMNSYLYNNLINLEDIGSSKDRVKSSLIQEYEGFGDFFLREGTKRVRIGISSQKINIDSDFGDLVYSLSAISVGFIKSLNLSQGQWWHTQSLFSLGLGVSYTYNLLSGAGDDEARSGTFGGYVILEAEKYLNPKLSLFGLVKQKLYIGDILYVNGFSIGIGVKHFIF